MKLKCNIIMALMLVIAPSVSANYVCEGLVKGLAISPTDGHVLVEQIGPLVWPRLCSVTQDINNVTAENCKVIYSTLMAAQLSQKKVTFWFNDSKDCSTASHPEWMALTGWYFGPKLND
jgi:hypothetical protein